MNAFSVYIGKDAIDKSWQDEFPAETKCCNCGERSRLAFVAIEDDIEKARSSENPEFVCKLYPNEYAAGRAWMHDVCAVAVYFCMKCLEPTAIANQA